MVKKRTNPVKERLKEFIASLGISEREFCRKIGVSSAYVESIKQSVSPKVMQTISIHYPELNPVWLYPELNPVWLLLGKEQMIKAGDEKPEANQQGGVLPSEMLAELLVEARNEKAWLRTENERLTSVVESQQETISELTKALKKAVAQQGDDATCAAVG